MLLEALLLLAATAHGATETVARSAPEGAPQIPIYRATGVRDAATAATVVNCTNLGPTTRLVRVEIFGFDGGLECDMAQSLAVGATRAFSSRLTAFYFDDIQCSAPPLTNQGSLLVSIDAWTQVICTIQLVDPASATPAFLEKLSLYNGDGEYLGFLIFADSFESGGLSDWSTFEPGGP